MRNKINDFVLVIIMTIVTGLPSTLTANSELVIGETNAISEVSVLDEIENSAAEENLQEMLDNTPKDTWSGFSSNRLPLALKNTVRLHRPMYTLGQDIRDHRNQIIYPKGYTFNPMAYIRLPSKVLIVGHTPDYSEFLNEHAGAYDMVLTAGGDPMKLGALYQRPVFILEPRMRDRLGVVAVPSIVSQQGDALQIREVVLQITEKRLQSTSAENAS